MRSLKVSLVYIKSILLWFSALLSPLPGINLFAQGVSLTEAKIHGHLNVLVRQANRGESLKEISYTKDRLVTLMKESKYDKTKKGKYIQTNVINPINTMIKVRKQFADGKCGKNGSRFAGSFSAAPLLEFISCHNETTIDSANFQKFVETIAELDNKFTDERGNPISIYPDKDQKQKDMREFKDLLYKEMRNKLFTNYWTNKSLIGERIPSTPMQALEKAHGLHTKHDPDFHREGYKTHDSIAPKFIDTKDIEAFVKATRENTDLPRTKEGFKENRKKLISETRRSLDNLYHTKHKQDQLGDASKKLVHMFGSGRGWINGTFQKSGFEKLKEKEAINSYDNNLPNLNRIYSLKEQEEANQRAARAWNKKEDEKPNFTFSDPTAINIPDPIFDSENVDKVTDTFNYDPNAAIANINSTFNDIDPGAGKFSREIKEYLRLKHGVRIYDANESNPDQPDLIERTYTKESIPDLEKNLKEYIKNIPANQHFEVSDSVANDWLKRFNHSVNSNIRDQIHLEKQNRLSANGDYRGQLKLIKDHPKVKSMQANYDPDYIPLDRRPFAQRMGEGMVQAVSNAGRQLENVNPKIAKHGLIPGFNVNLQDTAATVDKEKNNLAKSFLMNASKRLRAFKKQGLSLKDTSDKEIDNAINNYFKQSEDLLHRMTQSFNNDNAEDFVKNAVASNPEFVASVLSKHPRFAKIACEVFRDIDDDEIASRKMGLFKTAGLLLATGTAMVLLFSGVGTVAGASMLGGLTVYGLAAPAYKKYDRLQNAKLVNSRLVALGLGNDKDLHKALYEAEKAHDELIFSAKLTLIPIGVSGVAKGATRAFKYIKANNYNKSLQGFGELKNLNKQEMLAKVSRMSNPNQGNRYAAVEDFVTNHKAHEAFYNKQTEIMKQNRGRIIQRGPDGKILRDANGEPLVDLDHMPKNAAQRDAIADKVIGKVEFNPSEDMFEGVKKLQGLVDESHAIAPGKGYQDLTLVELGKKRDTLMGITRGPDGKVTYQKGVFFTKDQADELIFRGATGTLHGSKGINYPVGISGSLKSDINSTVGFLSTGQQEKFLNTINSLKPNEAKKFFMALDRLKVKDFSTYRETMRKLTGPNVNRSDFFKVKNIKLNDSAVVTSFTKSGDGSDLLHSSNFNPTVIDDIENTFSNLQIGAGSKKIQINSFSTVLSDRERSSLVRALSNLKETGRPGQYREALNSLTQRSPQDALKHIHKLDNGRSLEKVNQIATTQNLNHNSVSNYKLSQHFKNVENNKEAFRAMDSATKIDSVELARSNLSNYKQVKKSMENVSNNPISKIDSYSIPGEYKAYTIYTQNGNTGAKAINVNILDNGTAEFVYVNSSTKIAVSPQAVHDAGLIKALNTKGGEAEIQRAFEILTKSGEVQKSIKTAKDLVLQAKRVH